MIDLETSLKRMGVDIAWKDLHQGSLHHVAIYHERIHKGARGHNIHENLEQGIRSTVYSLHN